MVGGLPAGSKDLAGAHAQVRDGIAALLPYARQCGMPQEGGVPSDATLEEKWDEDIRLWFTTTEKLKAQGMTGKIWEEVSAPEDDDQDEDDEED